MKTWPQLLTGPVLKSGVLGGVLGLGIFLAGCGKGVSPESQLGAVSEAAPSRWVASKEGQAGVDSRWVRRFGSSSLNALVREAVTSNPSLIVAEERVKRAVILAKSSQAPALPQASAGLNGARNKQVFTGLPVLNSDGPLQTLSTTLGVSLDVSWEPDIWGRVAASQSAAIARVEAEGYAYRAASASLAAQVTKSWLSLGEANEQLALAKEALANRKEVEAAIEARFAQALADDGGTSAQLRLARTDSANATEVIERWKGEVLRIRNQLELLVGRYPAGAIGSGGVVLPRLPAKPPKGLPSELLVRRPDILEAERLYAAATKDSEVSDLARFPSFSLTSGTGRTSSTFSDLLDSDFGVWSLAGNLTVPILNGGSLQANYEASRSDERSALASLQRTVLDAFGEVEQALVADEVLDRRIAAVRDALVEAEAAEQASVSDYAQGLGSVLTLLQARDQRTQIATQLVTLRRMRLSNRVDLHLALGGDFQATSK